MVQKRENLGSCDKNNRIDSSGSCGVFINNNSNELNVKIFVFDENLENNFDLYCEIANDMNCNISKVTFDNNEKIKNFNPNTIIFSDGLGKESRRYCLKRLKDMRKEGICSPCIFITDEIDKTKEEITDEDEVFSVIELKDRDQLKNNIESSLLVWENKEQIEELIDNCLELIS